MSKVELDVDYMGQGRVVVDGVDLSHQVARVTIDSRANHPTRIYLEAKLGLGAIGRAEGLIFQSSGPDEVLAFLQNVDVVALEAATMEKLQGLDGSIQSPVMAMVMVLQEWAVASGDGDRT